MFSQFTVFSLSLSLTKNHIIRCGEKVNEQGRGKQIEGNEKLDRRERERENSGEGRVNEENNCENTLFCFRRIIKMQSCRISFFPNSQVVKNQPSFPLALPGLKIQSVCSYSLPLTLSLPDPVDDTIFLIHITWHIKVLNQENISNVLWSHVMEGGVDSG